jgi:hypothetical protein
MVDLMKNLVYTLHNGMETIQFWEGKLGMLESFNC